MMSSVFFNGDCQRAQLQTRVQIVKPRPRATKPPQTPRPDFRALGRAEAIAAIARPTVFVRGQGLAAELALRFLWLAEVGLRKARAWRARG